MAEEEEDEVEGRVAGKIRKERGRGVETDDDDDVDSNRKLSSAFFVNPWIADCSGTAGRDQSRSILV